MSSLESYHEIGSLLTEYDDRRMMAKTFDVLDGFLPNRFYERVVRGVLGGA